MNKVRSDKLAGLMDQLIDIRDELHGLWDEEEEYLANIPDNLQGSTRYEASSTACSLMSDAVDYLINTIDNLETVIEEE